VTVVAREETLFARFRRRAKQKEKKRVENAFEANVASARKPPNAL